MSLSSPSWMQIPGLVKQLMLLKVSCQNRAHNEGTESPTSSPLGLRPQVWPPTFFVARSLSNTATRFLPFTLAM